MNEAVGQRSDLTFKSDVAMILELSVRLAERLNGTFGRLVARIIAAVNDNDVLLTTPV